MADNQTLKEFEESLKSIKQTQKEIEKDFGSGLVFNLQKAILEADRLNEKFKNGGDVTKDLDKTVNKLLNTQITLNSKSLKLEKDLEKALKSNNTYRQQSLKTQIESVNAQKKLTESLLSEIDNLRDINESQGKHSDILDDILGKQATSIRQMFTLSGAFAFLVEAALKADKQTTNIAKSLTLTKGEAFFVREQFVAFSNDIADASITTSRLVESFGTLSKLVGFNVPLSKSLLKEFTSLTKNIGISEQAAGGLGKITLATGKNARQVTVEALGTAQALQAQNGIQLDNREVLEDIGKVSGQLLANFQANPSAIAEAVTQARLLGTNLETVRKQAESLLNFESSIENELKAELLTGQQINLERARAAALTGDQTTLMKELNNQNIDFNKFSKLNVIAQKSLAESLGLSADELSDQLFKQQMMGKSRAEVVAIGGEEAAQRLEQLSAQEKFNNAVAKLQDILGNLLAGPFGQLLSVLGDALNIVSLIGKPFALISNLINSILGPASTFGSILKGVLFTAAGIAVFLNPVKGLISLAVLGGVIAGIEALTKKPTTSMSDGVIGPGGETIVSGPKGSIKLDKNDSLVAGTNLFDKGNNNTMSSMVSAINEVRDAVNRLYNKDTSINMDGKKVGTTLTQGSYKVA